MKDIGPHSHCWIDPNEAPIHRAPYSPVIGHGRREMKPGITYQCRECKMILTPKAKTPHREGI